ncbi:MAG: NfeD family protein [Erysipelotrichaceae bacterium]|nr:NfeD family protein [Erysipelotrichaceae bacterium]
MEQYMWIVWLAIFVVAIIIEATTTELVSIFFCFGSIIALIISFIPGASWWIQLIVFIVVSGASLLGLRPLVHKYFNKEKRNTNVDELIGKKITILDLNKDNLYEAKVNGLVWRVTTVDEEEQLKENDKAEVVAISGNKLVVRKVEK